MKNIINGFEVIDDLGLFENGIRYGKVICKECKNMFQTSLYHLNVIKSCGCLPIKIPKKLPNKINGFKIIKDFGYSNGSRRALVVCKICNKEYEVDPNKLKYRKHCGCIKKGGKVSKFRDTHSRLLLCYRHMMARCYNKNNKDFHNYGKKGIKVCKQWKGNPDAFCEWALINGYKDNLSLDRIDSNDNYFPENCRWADAKMQARNTSRNVMNIFKAKDMRRQFTELVKKLAIDHGVSDATVYMVLKRQSWKN